MVKILAAFYILTFSVVGVEAQTSVMPMANRVPVDAVAYIGWAGADSLSDAYLGSDLHAFLEHSNLPQVANQYLLKLRDQLPDQTGDKQTAEALQKLLLLLWHHPVAIYASHLHTDKDGSPRPDVGIVCDAGSDAEQLTANLKLLIRNSPELKMVVDGSVVRLVDHNSTDAHLDSTLATDAHFVTTMHQLSASPAICCYVNAHPIILKENEAAEGHADAFGLWPKFRDALGIGNIETFAMAAGFDGSNWVTASALEAPNPRTGLLAVIEPKPIDPVLLLRIPASAGSVSVYNFDAAKLFDTIGLAMAVRPETDKLFHQAAGLATIGLGRNFRQQILGALGTQWVMYSDAKLHSVVVLNHPNDADAASDSMVSAVFGLANLANTQIPGATTQPVVNLEQKTVKGIDLTSAVTKFAAPTLAVKDGVLYLGVSAESVVNSASAPSNGATNNVVQSDNFLAAVKRLGIPNFASFDYCDLPSTAPLAYDNFGAAGSQVRQLMLMLKVDVPQVELPPLDQIKTHLSPALSVSWTEDKGVYSKSISLFPLSTYILGDPQQSLMGTATLSAATAIIGPIIQRSRSQAQSTQTMSNERQILIGMQMYAAQHDGTLPPDLGTLIIDHELQGKNSVKVFLIAESKAVIPDNILDGPPEEQATWVNDNTEFTFLLAEKKLSQLKNTSTFPALVPKNSDQATTRVAVGFADGHVEMVKPERAQHWLHQDHSQN